MSVRIGRVLGVPIEIHATWLIIFILLSYTIGFGFMAQLHQGMSMWSAIGIGAALAFALFLCLIVHELAHACTARRYGIHTRAISLFLLGGLAELSHDPDEWRQELAVSIAGPVASLILAVLFLLSCFAFEPGSLMSTMVFYLAFANGILGLANLIPSYPLDGGRILKAFLWRAFRSRTKATRIVTTAGECTGFLGAAYGIVTLFSSDWSGLWLVAIGWYLADAAARSWQDEQARLKLETAHIVTYRPATVQASWKVANNESRSFLICLPLLSDPREGDMIVHG